MYSLTEVLQATGGRLLFKGAETFTGLSIDSRTIRPGELFIALRGERFDGHDFVMDALKVGGGAIVSMPPLIPVKGKSIVYVPNTLKALHGIARYRRLQRATEVIGITGTNGKTTTKEMVARVLERRFRVLKSSGNLNNHIGLPLSLSRLNGHEVVVLEMGASRVGDIRQLCEVALPQTGVLTNIGPAHLEGFGTVEQVLRTKLELLEFVERLIVNIDDPLLREALKGDEFRTKDVLTYGLREDADIRAEDIRSTPMGLSFRVLAGGRSFPVRLRVFGRFNVYNALAATGVCKLFGCLDTVAEALEAFEGIPMRLQIKQVRDVTFISDMYNANPASMEEALKELVGIKQKRAVAVLGDMLELGAYEERAHRDLAEMLGRLPVEVFIAVGPRMATAAEVLRSIAPDREVIVVNSSMEAAPVLRQILRPHDVVLIKGSRAMQMEKVLNGLGEVEH